MPSVRPYIPAITALALTASAGLAQSTIEWASPVDGDFGVATNWFPAVVPGAMDTAVLGGVGAYRVQFAGGPVGVIDLENPDALLHIDRFVPSVFITDVSEIRGPGQLQIGSGVFGEFSLVRIPAGGLVDARVRIPGPSLSGEIDGSFGPCFFGPSAVISGAVQVNGDWTGPATIRIDEPGYLDLNGEFSGVTLECSGGGTLNYSRVVLTDATIVSASDSDYETGAESFVSDSVFVGGYVVQPSRFLRLWGGNVFEDGIVIDSGVLWLESDQRLDTSVRLVSGQLYSISDVTVMGTDAIVTGTGEVAGSWIGPGVFASDGPGVLEFRGQSTGGTFRSSTGGTLEFDSARLNGATIEVGDGGLFASDGGTVFTDTTILGSYRVRPNNELTLGPGVVADDGIVVGDSDTFGTAKLYVEDDVPMNVAVHLDGGTAAISELLPRVRRSEIGPQGTVTGRGSFKGIWFVDGTLAPGSDDGEPGLFRLLIDPIVRLRPSAEVVMGAFGPTPGEFDRIISAGTGPELRLDGTLRVGFSGGFVPGPGDRFEIIRVDTLEREFATVEIDDVPGVGPAHVVYTDTSVTVVICAADRDGDGELTIFDFLEFQNQFDAGDMRADLDDDGVLTIFDFLAFQNRFDAGCS